MTHAQSPPAVVLQVLHLEFGYEGVPIFRSFSASIPAGVGWIGGDESCGKTTLLKLLAAEFKPHAGDIRLGDTRAVVQPLAYRSQVFWTDPRTQAFDAMTPIEYWKGIEQRYASFAPALLSELVEGLALAPHLEKSLHMLSTGTKRKVFLAAAFASGAVVTLLDEPFAALDKSSAGLVLELLEEAASHQSRVWLVADYTPPRGVPLTSQWVLGG